MKLTSISLVVATFAAIAGTVIAAPGPLRARAINSFGERDVDANSDFVNDLFTRNLPHEGPAKAAIAHGQAAEAWKKVAENAITSQSRSLGLGKETYHRNEKATHEGDACALLAGNASQEQKTRAGQWDKSMKEAWSSEHAAKHHKYYRS